MLDQVGSAGLGAGEEGEEGGEEEQEEGFEIPPSPPRPLAAPIPLRDNK